MSARRVILHPERRAPLNWRALFRNAENRDMVAVAFLSFFLGFWVVYRYNWGVVRMMSLFRRPSNDPTWLLQAYKNDPKVGDVVKLPTFFDVDGKVVNLPERKGFTGLVFMTDYTSCGTSATIRDLETVAQRFPQMKLYLVAPTSNMEQVRSFWRIRGFRLPIVLDPDAQAAKRLNAIFQARGYLLDSSSKLLYITRQRQSREEVEQDLSRIFQQYKEVAQR